MSRVIYHYFGCENRFRIIEFLNEKHNWDPVMMMGRSSKKFSRLLEEKYPKCILESPDGLRKSEFDYSKFGQPVPIDSDIIAELSKYELSFLNNLYGTDPWIFSFQERRTHYYHVLRYWNTVINKLKPDLLVFNGWPHTPSCHSLYLLGKYYYNIDVLFVDTVPLFNGAYHTIGCSIEDLGAIVDDIYRSNEVLKMSSNVREYLNQVRSEKGLTPKYIVQSKKKFNNNRRLLTAVMRYLGLMRRIVSGDAFSNTVDYKSSRSPYYLKKSKANQVEYMFYVEKRSLDNYRLKRVYEKYCVEPDYAKKYLYFAATYQPEAVTATNAGVYDDLFLALDILSYSIPDDWVILYKENPMIFSASPLDFK